MTTLQQALVELEPVSQQRAPRAGRRSRPPRHRSAGAVDMTPWVSVAAVRARFEAKVARLTPDGCWYWLGAISSNGYGKFQLGSRTDGSAVIVGAHRFAYLVAEGELARGELVRHACDEPSCVNHRPGHMLAGSPAENALDWLARCHELGNPLGDPRGPGARARAIRDAILAAPTLELQRHAAAAAATYTIGTQLDLLDAIAAPAVT